MAKIGVFPATGGLGTSIIHHLIKLVPASDLILIARRPETLDPLKQAAATVDGLTMRTPHTWRLSSMESTDSTPIDLENPLEDIAIPHGDSAPSIAWVKRDELGEATATLAVSYVRDPARFAYLNQRILLSGARVLSLNETAEVLARVVGRPVGICQILVGEYVRLPQ
ncbi:hypothetical protein EYZ11_003918 [Aspergillus tanneri]|uniref:NAD(P)-binding domain-containing protein n=1 Tax=Aspergillus tanneri TaxID=1220188 RepID=A0A4S3JP50_9EURO|nr:hypothetical protein EYZ11_003918 [Aspergillus tanneri]